MITLKKSVVVFDVDGTLISSTKLIEDSVMETLKNYDSKIKTREDIKKFYGPDEVGMFRGLLKNPTLADNAFKEYLQHYEENDLTYIPKLIPGIGELLRELDTRRTLRLGCVTGRTKESLDITGERLNFLRFFEDIEVGSPKGVNKAETIKVLMRKFGVDRAEVIYVGDSASDIKAMKAVGVDIISVYYDHPENKDELMELNPNRTVGSVEDLRNLLFKLIR